ncbi:hypothetical protein LCGC14_2195630, partial [marine sediment metagenome]
MSIPSAHGAPMGGPTWRSERHKRAPHGWANMAKRATKTSDPWVGHNMAKRATETSEQMNRSGEQILLAIASTTSGQRLLATTSSAVPPIRPLYLKMPILPRGILPDAPWKVYPPFVGTVAGRQDSGPEARSYVAGGSGGRCPPCPGNSAGVRAELSACLPARGDLLAAAGCAERRRRASTRRGQGTHRAVRRAVPSVVVDSRQDLFGHRQRIAACGPADSRLPRRA